DQVLPDDGLFLTSAATGKEALETASKISPDLVIINAKLSDGDGASFIQPLRDLLHKPDLPIILLTEGREGTDTMYSAESVATDYLARPFSPPMLRTRVRAWLARTIGGTIISAEAPSPPQRLEARHEVGPGDSQPGAVEELISRIPLLMELDAGQRSWLLERATEHTFPPGHVIVRQEETGGS